MSFRKIYFPEKLTVKNVKKKRENYRENRSKVVSRLSNSFQENDTFREKKTMFPIFAILFTEKK